MEKESEKRPAKEESIPVLSVLDSIENYLTGSDVIQAAELPALKAQDSILFRVEKITFEEEAPWKEALENVLSAVRIPGIHFVYLLMGGKEGVRFYYGLTRDYSVPLDSRLSIAELGQSVLQASIAGNFRGSEVVELQASEKDPIFKKLQGMRYASRIEGVPGSVKDDERFQSADRLVDVMQGDEFCLLIISKALDDRRITSIERDIHNAYNAMNPLMKESHQEGTSKGVSSSRSHTEGTNSGSSESSSTSTTRGNSETKTKSSGTTCHSSGSNPETSSSNSDAKGTSDSGTEQKGTSKSTGSSYSDSEQRGENEGSSNTLSRDYLNRQVQDWLKYCDDVLLPRLDYGRGKGLFVSAIYVMAKSAGAQRKLENTTLSLYSGKQGNRVPLLAFPLKEQERQTVCRMQVPMGHFREAITMEQKVARALLSQPAAIRDDFPLANWITTNELAMIAGLPRKEVAGLRLREEVAFGLNCALPPEKERLELGRLVQDGKEMPISVFLDRRSLNRHLFVAGVTGSGKTTTCQKILLQSRLPFLVIEPAKTEYRIMKNSPGCEDLIVFTLGDDEVAPFRLNPLELLPGESLTSHVDMLKASIEAAFDMEAAIPQLIESALYRCYEKCGWDVVTGKNSRYTDPFSPHSDAFPTLSDLLQTIPTVVEEQGFDARLKNDYIGSIRARLQGLTLGAKGQMLNTRRSIDWDALLDKKVVFELEGIKSGSEKSLVMGFILSAFNEAVRERYQHSQRPHAHILLVEEAHRLLSRYQPGDSPNRKHGVEMFADMLAEIRKYGQCLIIADQIPNKMAEDVLKNTNTKIVHRLFAQDDKETIGNTMALTGDQKRFLSNLGIGRAVVFADGIEQAVQVQIHSETDTSCAPLTDEELRKRAFCYYWQESGKQIFLPLRDSLFSLPPQDCDRALRFVRANLPVHMLKRTGSGKGKEKWNEGWARELQHMQALGVIDEQALIDWCYAAFPLLRRCTGTPEQANVRRILREYFALYPSGPEAVRNIEGITEYFY